MKTLFFTLAIVATAALYGTEFFVPQSPDTVEGLVVLSNTEMSQRAGGRWTDQLISFGSDQSANCSVANCPDGTFTYTHSRYRCVPCDNPHDSAYTSTSMPKETTSWCDDYWTDQYPRCDYESYVTAWWSSCDAYQGACSD